MSESEEGAGATEFYTSEEMVLLSFTCQALTTLGDEVMTFGACCIPVLAQRPPPPASARRTGRHYHILTLNPEKRRRLLDTMGTGTSQHQNKRHVSSAPSLNIGHTFEPQPVDHPIIDAFLGEEVLLELGLFFALVDEKVLLPLPKHEVETLGSRRHLGTVKKKA